MRAHRLFALGVALCFLPGAGPVIGSTTAPAKRATVAWKPVVPFIDDDFGRALALARERKLPVFIEGWAPW